MFNSKGPSSRHQGEGDRQFRPTQNTRRAAITGGAVQETVSPLRPTETARLTAS